MASHTPYQWTPANNRTKFAKDQSVQSMLLDHAAEAERQQEHEALIWGLSIAAVVLLIVTVGVIRHQRMLAVREAERQLRDFGPDPRVSNQPGPQ